MIPLVISVSTIVIVIGIVFGGRLMDWHCRRKEQRQLIATGRSIDARRAISDYENGRGVLVHNRSLLPGEWWFLRHESGRVDYDLVAALHEFGDIVVFHDRNDRRAIEAYKGKVEELLEPF